MLLFNLAQGLRKLLHTNFVTTVAPLFCDFVGFSEKYPSKSIVFSGNFFGKVGLLLFLDLVTLDYSSRSAIKGRRNIRSIYKHCSRSEEPFEEDGRILQNIYRASRIFIFSLVLSYFVKTVKTSPSH